MNEEASETGKEKEGLEHAPERERERERGKETDRHTHRQRQRQRQRDRGVRTGRRFLVGPTHPPEGVTAALLYASVVG